jgi:cardiolipin synthase
MGMRLLSATPEISVDLLNEKGGAVMSVRARCCVLFAATMFLALCALAQEPALHPILDPSFQKELNAKTHSIPAISEDVQLLVNGTESYPVRWRLLENAKKTIHFTSMYIFRDDTTKRLGDLLIRKKNEGVDVKIIVYGTYATANLPFYHRMKKNGVPVQMYSSVPDVIFHGPMRFWKRHLHDKYLIVDGQEALMGGMNWSGRYERGGTGSKVAWRDTDIYVRGPQAEIVEKEFLARWNRCDNPEESKKQFAELDELYAKSMFPESVKYEDCLKPGDNGECEVKGLTRFLCQQPFEQDHAVYMTNFYKEIIDRAQKCVYWQSISTRPAPIQKKALMDAAARGVNVCLISNSKRNMRMLPIGGSFVYPITRASYKELLKAGIRIFEYSGAAPLHSKGFLVDDVVATVGSYNATFTSEKYYTESGLAIYDTEGVKAVRKMIEADLAECKEVTLDSLKPKRNAPKPNVKNCPDR